MMHERDEHEQFAARVTEDGKMQGGLQINGESDGEWIWCTEYQAVQA